MVAASANSGRLAIDCSRLPTKLKGGFPDLVPKTPHSAQTFYPTKAQ